MPMVSEAQRRLMHAQARLKRGRKRRVPAKVAREFVGSDEGGWLPERLGRKRVKGLR